MWPSCSEQKCTCRLVVLPSKLIAFFDVFIADAVVVATAPFFDLNVFVNSESTSYCENDPVLLRGIIIKCNEAFVIE